MTSLTESAAACESSLSHHSSSKEDFSSTRTTTHESSPADKEEENENKNNGTEKLAGETTDKAWPCANCHATVSTARCPFCHGIQVKIREELADDKKQESWMERLSPATVRRSPPPPKAPPAAALENLIEIEEEEEEEEDELDGSSTSPVHDIIADEDDSFVRPIDPVACTLASAPSPFPVVTTTTNVPEEEEEAATAVVLETDLLKEIEESAKRKGQKAFAKESKKRKIGSAA